MKIVILDKASLGDDTPFDALSRFGEIVSFDKSSPREAIERSSDADVIIINKVKVTEELMSSSKNLKLVCVFATGYDNIDVEAARRLGIAVCNVPGYSTESVTIYTVSTVLALYTHLFEYNAYTKSGAYSKGGFANAVSPVYHELAGKTWGIYGYGNIGRRVAAVASAFGCRVLVCKKRHEAGLPCVSLDTLAEESDILTVHTPLTEETRLSLDADRLSKMKKGSILVNVARGAVLDEAAVTELVLSGHIGGFATDVYTSEPFSSEHPYTRLFGEKNVILTPHMAWGAKEARERCIQEIWKNIETYVKGGIRNRVDLTS